MFTGIITDIGHIHDISRVQGSEWGDTRMEVSCNYDPAGIDIGASIAVSGACMTVTERRKDGEQTIFAFDVSDESLSKTTMGDWARGHPVNLERALTARDELGGHMVTGHVDGVGHVRSCKEVAGSLNLRIQAPEDITFGLAPKGSITVDGVSLTVNIVEKTLFEVNIIPHTAEVTTLGKLQSGDKVNLEIDVIARYVARYLDHMVKQKGL